jgi:hypothetical protein
MKMRLLGSLVLIAAAVGAALTSNLPWLLAATGAGLALRFLLWKSIAKALRSAVPIVVFAAILAVLQWFSHAQVRTLPLNALAVFLLSTAGFRIFPWTRFVSARRAQSRAFTPLLFALFVQHFASIFSQEASRVFQARGLCVTKPWGRGAFRSLAAAVAAVFSRALTRAEHFYAAQLLRGLAE